MTLLYFVFSFVRVKLSKAISTEEKSKVVGGDLQIYTVRIECEVFYPASGQWITVGGDERAQARSTREARVKAIDNSPFRRLENARNVRAVTVWDGQNQIVSSPHSKMYFPYNRALPLANPHLLSGRDRKEKWRPVDIRGFQAAIREYCEELRIGTDLSFEAWQEQQKIKSYSLRPVSAPGSTSHKQLLRPVRKESVTNRLPEAGRETQTAMQREAAQDQSLLGRMSTDDIEIIQAFLLAGVKDIHSAQDELTDAQWERAEILLSLFQQHLQA